MTFADTSDRPGIQESYLSAGSATDLSMDDSTRRQQGDILAASAMGSAHTGGMFSRLRSEYDGLAHPRPRTPQEIAKAALALGLPEVEHTEWRMQKDGIILPVGKALLPRQQAAAKYLAHQVLLHEMGLMLQQMKTWPAARTATVKMWGPEALTVLIWWLNPTCMASGCKEGFLLIPDTNRVGTRRCHRCEGGKIPLPGKDQKYAASIEKWITSSIARWRTATQKALRPDPESNNA